MTVSASATVTVVAAPVADISTLVGAQAGATGLTASVPSQAGATYAWTITGGSITAGATGNVATYAADSAGTLQLNCTVTNAAGDMASGSAQVVVARDVSGSYTYYYAANVLIYQTGTQVWGTWWQNFNSFPARSFSGTLNGSVITGTWAANDGSSSGAFVFTISSDGNTLAATWGTDSSSTGNSFSASKTAGAVSVSLTPVNPIVRTGQAVSFQASVAGSLNKGLTWTATGGSIDGNGGFTAPAAGGLYTVTATSQASSSAKASTIVSATPDGQFDVTGTYAYYYAANVRLYQSGTQVFGDWWQNFNSFPARSFSGTLNGRVVTGTWAANDGLSGGGFVFTLSQDKKTLTATWGVGNLSTGNSFAGSTSNTVSVKVLPVTAVLNPSENLPLTSYVAGSFNKAVNWSTTGGAVANNTYTAPSVNGAYTVTATSAASTSATANTQISVHLKVQVLPDTSSLAPGGVVQFMAQGYYPSQVIPVTWSVLEGAQGGSINANGTYTAPQTSGGVFHVRATSTQDSSQVGIALVTVSGGQLPKLSIAPSQANMSKGGTQTFLASVQNASDPTVVWSCTGGSIDQSGTYTAPNVYGTFTVTAALVSDPTIRDTATVVVPGGTASGAFTYDLNGNLTSDGTRTFTWDAENRLVSVTILATGHASQFVYDELGRRVEIVEKDGGTVSDDTRYLWDGIEIAEARNAAGNTVLKHFYSHGFVDSDGTNLYYTRDHLGSVRELTDTTQAIRARYDYDPYGRMTKVQGDRDAAFGYAGYFWHAPSGLNMTLYRAYDSNLGRWISRDPMGEKGGINLYEYCGNRPVNAVDPFGLKWDKGCLQGILSAVVSGFWSLVGIGLAAAGLLETGPLTTEVGLATVATVGIISAGLSLALGLALAGDCPDKILAAIGAALGFVSAITAVDQSALIAAESSTIGGFLLAASLLGTAVGIAAAAKAAGDAIQKCQRPDGKCPSKDC